MLTNEEQSEVRMLARRAKDMQAQIKILLEMFPNATRDEICRALGIENKIAEKKAESEITGMAGKAYKSYQQTFKDEVVKSVLIDGISHMEAAEKYGIPKGNVSRWVSAAKVKQAEFADYAEKVEKEIKGDETENSQVAAVPKQAEKPKVADAQSADEEPRTMEDGEAAIKIGSGEVLRAYKQISEGFEILKAVGLAEISDYDLENLKGKVSGFAIAEKYFKG